MQIASALVGLGASLILISCAAPERPRSPHWNDKASSNARDAERRVGGFDANERRAYRIGIQHIVNQHEHVGSYTISQVVKQELRREELRREAAQQESARVANAKKRAYDETHGPRSVSAACDAFHAKLGQTEGIGAIVKSEDCRGQDREIFHVDVTIRDEAWTSFTYDQRLRLAKSLWYGAVGAARLTQADAVHVRLIGEAGEDLGGSNSFAGSMIDVRRD
jgi:hypothetical protein